MIDRSSDPAVAGCEVPARQRLLEKPGMDTVIAVKNLHSN
jgi:hypothetical protein